MVKNIAKLRLPAKPAKSKADRLIPKADKQSNKGWVYGVRATILHAHVEAYAAQKRIGISQANRYCGQVSLEYHTKVSWRLEPYEEVPLPLPNYVNGMQMPIEDHLTEEEQRLKSTRIKEKDKAIKRWLNYQVKLLDPDGAKTNRKPNPALAMLLNKLAGVKPARARVAYQEYLHEEWEAIKEEVDCRWESRADRDLEQGAKRAYPNMAFRAEVARDLFLKLEDSEQKRWVKLAADRTKADLEHFRESVEEMPTHTPEERQDCIDNLFDFIVPILEGVQAMTGLHVTLIAGGPMHQFDGDISSLHFHIGESIASEDNPSAQWGLWDQERFDKTVVGFFNEYLEECFPNNKLVETDELYKIPPRESSPIPFDGDMEVDSVVSPKRAESSKRRKGAGGGRIPALQVDEEGLSDDGIDSFIGGGKADYTDNEDDSSPLATPSSHLGRYERERKANIANIQAQMEAAGLGPVTPPPQKRKRKRETVVRATSDPQRRSTRQINVAQKDKDRLANAGRGTRQPASSNFSSPQAVTPIAQIKRTTIPRIPALALPAVASSPPTRTPSPDASPAPELSPATTTPFASLPPYSTLASRSSRPTLEVARAVTPPIPAYSTFAPAPSITPPPASPPHSSMALGPRPRPVGELSPTVMPPVFKPTSSKDGDDEAQPTVTKKPGRSQKKTGAIRAPSNTQPNLRSKPAARAAPTASSTQPKARAQAEDAKYIEIPLAAPDWLPKACAELTQIDLDPSFTGLLDLLIQAEVARDYEITGPKLTTTNRPPEVTKWINNGRCRANIPPIVKDVAKFKRMWWQWWAKLQPKWRRSGQLQPYSRDTAYGTEWGSLNTGGMNGIFSVLAALYWWGCASVGREDFVDDWMEAVRDTEWMMMGVLDCLEGEGN